MTTLAVWQAAVVDDAGNIKAGAQVRVMLAGTATLATLKPARDGSGSLGNPFAADATGFAQFYVAQGRYDIRVTFPGSVRDLDDVVLFADTALNFAPPVYQLATPASGTTEDYAPAGFDGNTTFLDLDLGAGSCTIGGLVGMVDGQRLTIRNKHASNTATLKAESSGSTAAYRFSLPFDLTLLPGDSRTGTYIAAIARLVL